MNILLLYDNRELDRQVLRPVDYAAFEQDWIVQHGGNSGNKLYNTAVEQYLTKEDITYGYYTGEESMEQINDKYDLAILTVPNIFNANPVVTRQLDLYADLISRFRIPVYIIGCGLQCASYDEIPELAAQIREPAQHFIKAVYQTGGELALRGYATKDLLDRIMPNTAVVTGCPSLYQRGRYLHISGEKVSEDRFKPTINGNLKYLKNIGMLDAFREYPDSIYVDQDEFAKQLYFHSRCRDDLGVELVRKKTAVGMQLLAQRRVRLFYDIPIWLDFFAREQISFSCGSRIHGNIAATLSGTPAMVLYRDARTRELAEFFELPCAAGLKPSQSLYEAYLEADYTEFNRHFEQKFEAFESFMTEHGISHDLDDRSLFEEHRKQYVWKDAELIGERKLGRIGKKWERYHSLYCTYEKVLDAVRGVADGK